MSFIKYIADESHYKEDLSLVRNAKRTVWIGTADIKDLYVEDKPFLSLIASLLKKGVEVRSAIVYNSFAVSPSLVPIMCILDNSNSKQQP